MKKLFDSLVDRVTKAAAKKVVESTTQRMVREAKETLFGTEDEKRSDAEADAAADEKRAVARAERRKEEASRQAAAEREREALEARRAEDARKLEEEREKLVRDREAEGGCERAGVRSAGGYGGRV